MTEAHRGHVVVIDDDPEMRSMCVDQLTMDGYRVREFSDGREALVFLNGPCADADSVELILTDLRMPEVDGISLLRNLRPKHPDIPVILMTAYASVESAVEGLRKGAFDYLIKPFKLAEMSHAVERAVLFGRLKRENRALVKEVKGKWALNDIVGKSAAIQEVFALVEQVADSSSSILITGESGTGKEVIARAIHQKSPRRDKQFVAVNCTAIPDSLMESELFGYLKGAFTGANSDKRGLFDEAEGGTLFLDEIGDMNVALQAKLLRVLQDRTIRPVGGTQHRSVDVRIVAATHKDLKKAIANGTFREDLYYRLAVIPIVMPALRHRSEDIPLLAQHFLNKYSLMNGGKVHGFAPEAVQRLLGLTWPGNVRELENLIERLVVLSKSPIIQPEAIPIGEDKNFENFFGQNVADLPSLEELERRYIHLVLEKTGARKEKAAQILGINRRTLYRKEREFGFVTEDQEPEE
ncbi:MAG: sigma-54-dependent Fis family transcriptional regulator [Bdellovibrionales bacterium]|nr:sigma-54-dependent Fis family transcriptional regulator [Bdellovibrionales bacterium]